MILISIGANLPGEDGAPAIATCIAAVEAMQDIPGLQFVAQSPWYRSAPIPPSGQPDFCNGVARFEGDIAPMTLLEKLHEIEDRFGRVRGEANASRTMDLDIIDLHGLIRATPAPILPHPRAHMRAFVLRPMLDVAPNWRHPTLRQGVSSMLSDLPPQQITPWPEP